MDVTISALNATVRAVDDRTLASPEVIDVIVREVLRRLESERTSDAARRDEARLWNSVREEGAG